MSLEKVRSRIYSIRRLIPLVCVLMTVHIFDARTHGFQQKSYTTKFSKSTIDHTRQLLPHMPSLPIQSFHRINTNQVQYAIIYGGDDGDYQSEEEFDASLSIASGDPNLMQLLSDRIYSEFPPSFMINIACAQAPPPHNHLKPQDCLSAELISVDMQGAQIAVSTLASAGGGGDGRCVQILIPVQFEPNGSQTPSSTEPSIIADQIVQQFQQLEITSLKSNAKKEWEEDNADQLSAQEKVIFELQDESSLTDELLPD